jgi:hypothetical protein
VTFNNIDASHMNIWYENKKITNIAKKKKEGERRRESLLRKKIKLGNIQT